MKPRIDNTTYYVNKEKKSVTCVMRGYTEWDEKVMDIRLKNNGIIDPLVWGRPRCITDYMEFTVCATTRCTENDEFDENTGRKIALKKARVKLYKEIAKLNCAINLGIAMCSLDDLRKYEKLSALEYLEYEEDILGIELPKKISVKTDTKERVFELRLDDETCEVMYVGKFKDEDDDETYEVPVLRCNTRRDMLEHLESIKGEYEVVEE